MADVSVCPSSANFPAKKSEFVTKTRATIDDNDVSRLPKKDNHVGVDEDLPPEGARGGLGGGGLDRGRGDL